MFVRVCQNIVGKKCKLFKDINDKNKYCNSANDYYYKTIITRNMLNLIP